MGVVEKFEHLIGKRVTIRATVSEIRKDVLLTDVYYNLGDGFNYFRDHTWIPESTKQRIKFVEGEEVVFSAKINRYKKDRVYKYNRVHYEEDLGLKSIRPL